MRAGLSFTAPCICTVTLWGRGSHCTHFTGWGDSLVKVNLLSVPQLTASFIPAAGQRCSCTVAHRKPWWVARRVVQPSTEVTGDGRACLGQRLREGLPEEVTFAPRPEQSAGAGLGCLEERREVQGGRVEGPVMCGKRALLMVSLVGMWADRVYEGAPWNCVCVCVCTSVYTRVQGGMTGELITDSKFRKVFILWKKVKRTEFIDRRCRSFAGVECKHPAQST